MQKIKLTLSIIIQQFMLFLIIYSDTVNIGDGIKIITLKH
jgi:hypothetical protein